MTLLMSDWSIVKVSVSLHEDKTAFSSLSSCLLVVDTVLQALVRCGCFSLSSCPPLLAAVIDAERCVLYPPLVGWLAGCLTD